MKNLKIVTALFLCGILFSPLATGAQEETTTTPLDDPNEPSLRPSSDPYAFQRHGVFGCNQTGAYAMSVGSLSASGGAYVPVDDAAVRLNTGYLVYKECVLRGIVVRQREAATAALLRGGTINFETGRNGNPMYPVDYNKDVQERSNETIVRFLQSTQNDGMNPAFKGVVDRAIAQGYVKAMNQPQSRYACSYAGGNLEKFYSGEEFSWGGLIAAGTPGCNPVSAYFLKQDAAQSAIALDRSEMDFRLMTSNGIYGVEKFDENGNRITVTPGSIVASNFTQLLQTGFRQLESANDIDQMVGSLFAGITSHVIGDSRGLAGLTQSSGGQTSYLDQVSKEAAAGVRNAAVNAALQILSSAKQVESTLKQILDSIANTLATTINTLRAREAQCWNLIIYNDSPGKRVCSSQPTGNTCVAEDGTQIRIATSTAFSQAVVNAQIAAIASSTIADGQKATTALTLIDRLIDSVTNTASVEAQRVALQQLDGMVAQNRLHNKNDLEAAQKRQQDVAGAMATLITDTTAAWADSTDATIGWCNVNNPSVIERWKNAWKK